MLERVRDGSIQGLRIDHPDGLVDPGGYLDRLRAAAPDAWITIEKILEPGEVLPAQWPVDGTTGYDALTEITNVVTDPGASDAFTSVYREITGDQRDFADHVADGKRGIATTILQSELLRLARLVPDVDGAVSALTELAVAFPVYRSYLPLGREYLDEAIATAVAPASRDPGRRGRAAAPPERPGRRAVRAVPAGHRRDHGQGRRGHRVLPLHPRDLAQRGRRRPGRVRGRPAHVPPGPAPPASARPRTR